MGHSQNRTAATGHNENKTTTSGHNQNKLTPMGRNVNRNATVGHNYNSNKNQTAQSSNRVSSPVKSNPPNPPRIKREPKSNNQHRSLSRDDSAGIPAGKNNN